MVKSESPYIITTLLLTGLALFFVLTEHLLAAFMAGFIVFELIRTLTPPIANLTRTGSKAARVGVVVAVSIIVISLLALIIFGLTKLLITGSDNLPALLKKMAEILEGTRSSLPTFISQYLPNNIQTLEQSSIAWLREHASILQSAGKQTGLFFAHILIGSILGVIIAFEDINNIDTTKPFPKNMLNRIQILSTSFRNVVFAQGKIAFINSVFTGIYLLILLPLFGIKLPFAKTLVGLTFLFGLIPVIGNLVTNTFIVVISLKFSIWMAMISLIFLVTVHKLEYFLNARIVGNRINASSYEILIAMLVFEALFGLRGVIVAPIIYAYIKAELKYYELI